MSAVAVGAVEAVTKDGCVLNVAGALVANWASAQRDYGEPHACDKRVYPRAFRYLHVLFSV